MLRRCGPPLLLLALCAAPAPAEERPAKKVLFIGIDGCRPDAIPAAVEAVNLKALIKEGAYSDKTDVLGDRKTGADTATGPGWASALTGVWADRHGVTDNAFRTPHFDQYPTFFRRLKESRRDAVTVALVTWLPFKEHYFPASDGCRLVLDGDKKGYLEGDKAVAREAVKVLGEPNLDAAFVYFGNVDSAGHGYGFHPKSPRYTKEIETVDGYIGDVLKALRARTTYAKEDWLVIVCTDHGGQGRGHGAGEKVPESRTGFLILHGPSVEKGTIEGKTYNVDVAATVLTHLGVAIKPEWKLDGRAVGLKKASVP
jgi:predicted AlkP superfamily pyrophosphatase or phosphodiesterase